MDVQTLKKSWIRVPLLESAAIGKCTPVSWGGMSRAGDLFESSYRSGPVTFENFRDYLPVAEDKGLLKRVSTGVDRSWEPAALAKWVFQALPNDQRFGLMFDNVEGSKFPLVIGALGASTHSYALALGVEPDNINDKWVSALLNTKDPVIVQDAPCQENVILGDEVDLDVLPIPTFTPGKDVGPYITTTTITRDADTGAQNMGVYRTMVRDSQHVLANLSPGRNGHNQMMSHFEKGQNAPIAWVIGSDPACQFASVANMPPGYEEIKVAGGLKGEGIKMVKCQTSDIMVPANAEIIIEGELLHDAEYGDEGPFGEFAGYMSPIAKKPVARITAITYRNDAIYYGYTSQMPPSESTVLQSLSNSGVVLKALRHDHGEAGVVDAHIDLTFGGLLAHCIVAVKPGMPGHAKKIGRILASTTPLKRITIVDEDVDIRDPLHIEWAMNSHYNPVRDTEILDDVYFPMHMDPSVRVDNVATELGSKVIIDATKTIDAGELSLPPKEVMMRALESWKAAGLPEFEIPKRAASRIERS